MSDQSFNTNGPLPASSQPVPIAKQLEAQAYLCQVQNQLKDSLKKEGDASISKLPERFSNYTAPQEETEPPRVNKMDAFFLQAEEEERQRALAANATVEAPEQTVEERLEGFSGDFAAEHQPSEPIEHNETPSVEFSQIDVIADEVAAPPEVADPFQVQQDAEFTPTPQEPSRFSVNSFSTGSFGQNSTSDVQSQFISPQQEVAPVETEAPVETISSSPEAFNEPPTFQQPPSSQPQFESPELPESPDSPESTDNPETRRLTGAAGLSAGLALAGAAGMGALGASATSGASSEVNDWVESQMDEQPAAIGDSLEAIRQQLANGEGQVPSGGGVALEPESDVRYEAAPEPRNVSQFSNDPNDPYLNQSQAGAFDQGNAQPSPMEQDASAQYVQPENVQPENVQPENVQPENVQTQNVQTQNVQTQNVQPENTSSTPQQLPPVVAGGFSGGFRPLGQPSAAPSASQQQGQPANVDSAANDAEQNIAPLMAPQPQVQQTQPTQSSAAKPERDDEVEDMRAAAERQAQRIKAERAKALVDGPDVPARPYGAADNTRSASPQDQQALAEKLASLEAAQAPVADAPQVVAANPQPAQPLMSKPLEVHGNEIAHPPTRSFPMDLFNKHLLRNLRSGVVFVDHKRRVQLWSKGAEAMTGIVSDAVIERPLYPQTFNLRFEDGTGVPMDRCPIVQCLETMETVTSDYRTLNAENQEVRIEIAITPVIDESRHLNGAIIILNDHTAEIDLQRQLKDLYEFSVLDPLTQVANRAEFERVLEEYVRAFNQSESFNCSIIICDIDFFKSINDKFGHAIGDEALVAFSEMLKKYVRSQDLVARYGGEEFVILCADCDTDAALQRAEQIRMGLYKTPQPMLDGKSISASFGVSELRPGDTAMEFFVRADTALLRAKELGRNRVVIADQREANRQVNTNEEGSLSGMQWRQQRREHTALICEEFKTSTPVPVLVEKLRGFIVEKDAWLQRVDQEFLSMEVDFEAPNDYSRKGSFTMNIELKEGDEDAGGRSNKMTFIRVTIFPGRRKKWFATNHTDVAPHLLSDLRSYLMINDEASHLSIKMATEDVRAN